MPSTLSPTLTLNDGRQLPQLGLGTYGLNGSTGTEAVVNAAELGYRLFDTAFRYGNEAAIGAGVLATGLPREELFVTTKLDGEFQGGDRAVAGLDESLRHLGLDYVDLTLIHWPLPGRDLYVDTWKTFERLLASGKTKSIGVSNFKPAHLERLRAEASIVPAVNQLQLDPTIARLAAREYNAAHGIVVQGWSPLGGVGSRLSTNQLLVDIAASHERTTSQIILRWFVELGLSVVPKSGNPARMAANLHVFDFELTAEEMAAIARLDAGEGAAHDSDVIGH
jgi:2,5-diketo-D-gluconate reductase A